MYKKRTKIIASMLVLILTITHLNIIGEVLATSLESQSTQTNNSNVEFDSYFTSENAKEHSAMKTIGEENYLYVLIKVKEAGYLKNAIVEAKDANFTIGETQEEIVSKVENNQVYFNKIKNGNTVEVALPIQILQSSNINIAELNKETKIMLTATYVDGNGKEQSIEKEITVNLAWTAEKEAQLNMQVAKFIPYDINGSKGLVLQTIVQSYLKDNTLPVKENKIEISVPTINNNRPQEVKVVASSTKATNGDETGVTFTEENYSYNEETNKLTITVQNEADDQGKVAWNKEAQDEFIVTYIYPETEIAEEGVNVAITANNEIKIYEATETKAQKDFSGEVTLKDQISSLVDFNIVTNVESLSKGQIYANYETQNKIETEYQETVTANIAVANLTDKIILEQKADNFVTAENTKSPATQTYYKTITVDKNEFNKILGEDGEIYFYLGTTEIAKINKETRANEQGKLIADLSEANINNLRIETSKPVSEGKINFTIVKAIKGETGYTKVQMASFNSLEVNVTGKAVNGEKNFVEQALTKEITFVKPISQAELVIDNSNLSTVVTNENVKITAILKTDTLDCMLYQNPTLQITMPSYIENINIKNIEVLFDTENSKLTLKSYQIVPNADGTKTIVINLEGTQTEYTLGAVSKGVNIVITSDITVNKFTPNKQDKITMVYTNSNVITLARASTQEVGEVSTELNIVAPTGVVTTNTISNYAENAESLTSISGEEKTATIPILSEARNANFSMEVMNNYNNTIDNISILGRTLFAGNKDIASSADLGSTMNMPLVSNIEVAGVDASKVTIYYSENANATKDINLTSNGWTTTPSNLANVKSYLITLTDTTMNTGDNISFNYVAQIPANLQHNQSAYENYVVYFNNNLETGTIEDKQVATKVGVTTGRGPVIEASMVSNKTETEEVLTGNIIKYTLTVKNTGTETANNVVATIDLPTYFDYVEEDKTTSLGYKYVFLEGGKLRLSLGTIGAEQEVTKEIWLKTAYISEDLIKTELKAKIISDNIKEIETNNVTNTIKKAYYKTSSIASASNDYVIKENSTYKILYTIKSTETSINRNNTIVTIFLPPELNYEDMKLTKYNKETGQDEDISSEADIQFDSFSRKLTINIGEIDGFYGKELEVTTIVGKLPENVYEQKISIQANVKGDNISEESIKAIEESINKAGLEVLQTSSIPDGSKIAVGEDFQYIIEIKNLSNVIMNNIIVTDYLPKELIYKYAKITYKNGLSTTSTKITEEGYPIIELNIEANSSTKIEINVVADIVSQDTNIANMVKIEHKDISTIESNTINHIMEKYDELITNPSEVTTKRIMGQVWIDENANGLKEENEEKVSNVEMLLFNNATGELVRNSNGDVLRVSTDENGSYTFAGIAKGKYTVIFLYDTANYSATTYRKEGVDETQNSDAVDSKITLDGVTRVAAITEEVAVTDSNIYNIDLGLVSNPKFDLKLDKTVSKITVQDATGTDVYEYQDSKLAKKDLVGKQIANTTIIVEYKITVTNEGAISGFVKKIADYMPEEMKFNSELNTDWYTSENGILYNSSLANTIINPGESKEVTLILTKKMTEDNLGLYHNEAEIHEAYNDLGIADVDSTPGNKVSTEDDISSADVLITVKTGETILFVGLTLTIIITIGIGTYFIKKKVIR